MNLLKCLLSGVFFVFIYCSIFAQTNSKTEKDSLDITCMQCDSLYSQICPDNPKVFGHPERSAEFPGGAKALMIFLGNHIQYPAECKEKTIQGRVTVKFIIDESGKIICPYILKSLHPLMDEEVLRVIKLMPDWVPESNRGVPRKSCYSFPVRFKL